LKTDENARVLNDKNKVIGGLFAVGNDAASAFGGTYPAAGITVGLALTFGFVAGQFIAAEAKQFNVS
jgi:predicted oxidoreductase